MQPQEPRAPRRDAVQVSWLFRGRKKKENSRTGNPTKKNVSNTNKGDGRPRTNVPLQHLPHPGCPAPKQVPDLSLPPIILHVGPSEPHASEAAPGDDLTTFTRCAESTSTRLPSNPTTRIQSGESNFCLQCATPILPIAERKVAGLQQRRVLNRSSLRELESELQETQTLRMKCDSNLLTVATDLLWTGNLIRRRLVRAMLCEHDVARPTIEQNRRRPAQYRPARECRRWLDIGTGVLQQETVAALEGCHTTTGQHGHAAWTHARMVAQVWPTT